MDDIILKNLAESMTNEIDAMILQELLDSIPTSKRDTPFNLLQPSEVLQMMSHIDDMIES